MLIAEKHLAEKTFIQWFFMQFSDKIIRCGYSKLEYLAVYGRASMAAFRQLSTHIVPPRSNVREARLNTHGQKFDPESLYKPIKFETLQPYLVNKY